MLIYWYEYVVFAMIIIVLIVIIFIGVTTPKPQKFDLSHLWRDEEKEKK